MSDDPFKQFDELVEPTDPRADRYPGSKPPVNRQSNVVPINQDMPVWDDRPLVKIGPDGRAREWFLISALATALGRKEVTLRMWESKGLLPPTPFRTPPPSNPLPDRPSKGRRLWTRAQIEGVLRIANEEGVILNRGLPPTERFSQRVAMLYAEIRNAETQR